MIALLLAICFRSTVMPFFEFEELKLHLLLPRVFAAVKADVFIDHFIHWSYAAHDELWNLSPTTSEINSSKSNHLPDWNSYFPKLCELEYKSYSLVWRFEPLHEQYEKCLREHVNSVDVQHKMYRVGLDKEEFFSQLEEIILPVFKDAVNLGFEEWKLN